VTVGLFKFLNGHNFEKGYPFWSCFELTHGLAHETVHTKLTHEMATHEFTHEILKVLVLIENETKQLKTSKKSTNNKTKEAPL